MKILLISDVYFPRINGVSTSIHTLITQLHALGHEVHLIAPEYHAPQMDETWIKRVSARHIFFDPEDKLMRYYDILALENELLQVGYDLIHIHTPFVAHYAGLKLAKKLNIPVVETYHTFFEDYLHCYLPWMPRWLAKSIARKLSKRQCNAVNGVIAPSLPMREVLEHYGVRSNMHVIPTGLTTKNFEYADGMSFRAKYGIPWQRPMMLYVGRVAYEKNIDFLVRMTAELVKHIPDILFVITGEGSAEQALHQQVQMLGLQNNIMFIGYLDREQALSACYAAADVFVFASKTETQGLVLLEAMAQSKPVVALAQMGTKSILIEGVGAMIAPEDEVLFALKVKDLLANSELRQQLCEKAKTYAKYEWSAEKQTERMLSFYQQVLQTVKREEQFFKLKTEH